MTEHDPFNEPETAHARARELMVEPLFWDCVDEAAPFGSDEGSEAYYEWRNWRAENPGAPLIQCFDWILDGQLAAFNEALASDAQIEIDAANPDDAFLAQHYDMYTLDTTIIATGLGQLMDEGSIDSDAKPFMHVAIKRQRNPKAGHYDASTLDAIARVVDDA
ncbi:molybdate metabolism regulator [Planctomycetaceae bacterium SH139]